MHLCWDNRQSCFSTEIELARSVDANEYDAQESGEIKSKIPREVNDTSYR